MKPFPNFKPHPVFEEYVRSETRRQFLRRGASFLGTAALVSSLAFPGLLLADDGKTSVRQSGPWSAIGPHFPPKATRVIYLHMVGGPSQMDLFDYKPVMNEWYDKELPDSVRMGQRITTMTSGQKRFPVAPSKYKFAQYGQNGMWISELLPWTAKMADDLCFIRSMRTDAINHEPAITYMQTGNMVTGRPCIGSWVSYGLGSLNQSLPTFVGAGGATRQYRADPCAILRAAVVFRVICQASMRAFRFVRRATRFSYINNPDGVDAKVRRKMLRWLEGAGMK